MNLVTTDKLWEQIKTALGFPDVPVISFELCLRADQSMPSVKIEMMVSEVIADKFQSVFINYELKEKTK